MWTHIMSEIEVTFKIHVNIVKLFMKLIIYR